jgi:NFU1 iron-sulfur cluster scaffold homolog, mitochondrial
MIQISIEPTPNPATMKFRFSQPLLEQPWEFLSPAQAERSPLAFKIFGFPWTSAVYLGTDFVSVTKQDWVEWDVLAEPLASLIQEHFNHGEPLLVEGSSTDFSDEENDTDSDLVKDIKRVLKREIRPVVAMDGGDVTFANFANGTLFLHMKGACSGCPSSQATLKQGIETRLRELFPEIQEVVAQS